MDLTSSPNLKDFNGLGREIWSSSLLQILQTIQAI